MTESLSTHFVSDVPSLYSSYHACLIILTNLSHYNVYSACKTCVFILLDSAKHFFTKTSLVHHLQMQTEWESRTGHNDGSFPDYRKVPIVTTPRN